MTTASVAFDLTNKRGKKVPGAPWINTEAVTRSGLLGDPTTNAQVHPRLLTQRMARDLKVVTGQAHQIKYADGRPVAVVASDSDNNQQELPCTDVVIATGPWSGKFMKRLFEGDAEVDPTDYDIGGSRAHSVGLLHSFTNWD